MVDGTEQWVSLDSFNEQYGRLLDRLNYMGVGSITCSYVYIDENLFLGSPAEYLAFRKQEGNVKILSHIDLAVLGPVIF